MEQKQIRKEFRKIRQNIKNRQKKDLIIVNKVLKIINSSLSRNFAVYLAMPEEVSLNLVINLKRQSRLAQNIFLPKMIMDVYTPNKDYQVNKLNFLPLNSNTHFKIKKYGIIEPLSIKQLGPKLMDVVFVPLVVFDQQGNRMGMGKGFYDQSFAFKKSHLLSRTKLIGVAYQEQCYDKVLPTNSYDVKLNTIITDENDYTF